MDEESLRERNADDCESGSEALTILAFAERRVDEVFERYGRELLGALFFLCDGVESVTLASFASLREKCRLDAQRNEISNLRAWIFRSLYNESLSVGKKRKKPRDHIEAPVASGELEDAAFRRYARVRAALLELPFHSRAVFVLRQNGGLTYEQIAQTVDKSVATVKDTMCDVIATLSNTIDQPVDEEACSTS